jgi:hypothetical protein
MKNRNTQAEKDLKSCLDKCYKDTPRVIIYEDLFVLVECLHKSCANIVKIKGSGEQEQLQAMLEWNHLIRNPKK